MIYPIIEIPNNAPDLPEQQGTKTKYWVSLKDDKQKMLFKIGRVNTGENWSEKVTCELAELFGLPHAHYDLAVWKAQKGIIAKNFVPDNGRLITVMNCYQKFIILIVQIPVIKLMITPFGELLPTWEILIFNYR